MIYGYAPRYPTSYPFVSVYLPIHQSYPFLLTYSWLLAQNLAGNAEISWVGVWCWCWMDGWMRGKEVVGDVTR